MIRKAVQEDIISINEIGTLLTEDFKDVNNIEKYISDSNKLVIVYEDLGSIVGFLIVQLLQDEMEILDIAVKETYQQKKIATKLINYLFDNYNIDTFLEVNINNEKAINLYKKFNFKILSTRNKYYKDEDAYIMKKEKI